VLLSALFDDAALFPPGNAPMAEAVAAHLAYRTGRYAGMVGPFVCPDSRLTELQAAFAVTVERFDVSVVSRGGGADVVDAIRRALGDPRLRVWAVELPLESLTDGLPSDIAVWVELSMTLEGLSKVDAAYGVKLRTGGTTANAFPDEETLGSAIAGCVRAGRVFKCTAGLHAALRHRDPATGLEQHGFLNVMLAAHAALGGADGAAVAEILARRDAAEVVDPIRHWDAATAREVRRTFASFGTCSIDEPLADLTTLGLL
jgi:hypothetical protein